ncbi:hypothetical protein LAZ67_3005764 [Cordylochernes scorpioides]|uniref:guanylate kinase n=1 Tax=Cordylochernes scorpioides TaxID=51811 RepID=A0ABY6KAP5_9ARAC|nr:hypothetical protein LAZ67_3005764 [Cordylochernes scorpioides]
MLNELENNPDFLDNVVTGDESWTFQYDPETKAQSSEWHTPASPRPKKARMSKSPVKTMLIVFFDKQGLIHKEFVPQGKTVNAEFYKEVLRRLHKAVKRKRQDLAQRWRLHHDNAPAHTAFLVTSYLTRIGVEVLPQPPYSPDMRPPDFFLFPKVKGCLKGHRFDDIPNIQRAVTKALTWITPTDYSGAYEAWKTRWQRCVDAQSEGNNNMWCLDQRVRNAGPGDEQRSMPALVVVCGPSGSGKSTIIRRLLEEYKDQVVLSVSHTSRSPRPGEVHGKDYFFVSRTEMKAAIEGQEFLEHTEYCGNLYGTHRQTLEKIPQHLTCVLDVDQAGVRQLKQCHLRNIRFVFIQLPDIRQQEAYLRKRGTETEEQLQKRLAQAHEEINFGTTPGNFDLIIINDNLEKAYTQFKHFVFGTGGNS